MGVFKVIIAAFAVCVCMATAEELAELKIETIFKPEDCANQRLSRAGDELEMHYTGKIAESSATGEKGSQFDSSVGRSPFKFNLGGGQVIKGWDEGLLGMCVGEKRELTIPPHLGYGENGAGGTIPGGATLHFEVECLGIADAPPQPNIFEEIDADKDGKLTKEEVGAWFKEKQQMDELPPSLWENEDKDKDGFISWEEFSGPKGSAPPSGEDADETRDEL